jgi:hypothetical protein
MNHLCKGGRCHLMQGKVVPVLDTVAGHFPCGVCGQYFNRRDILARHRAQHERPEAKQRPPMKRPAAPEAGPIPKQRRTGDGLFSEDLMNHLCKGGRCHLMQGKVVPVLDTVAGHFLCPNGLPMLYIQGSGLGVVR